MLFLAPLLPICLCLGVVAIGRLEVTARPCVQPVFFLGVVVIGRIGVPARG